MRWPWPTALHRCADSGRAGAVLLPRWRRPKPGPQTTGSPYAAGLRGSGGPCALPRGVPRGSTDVPAGGPLPSSAMASATSSCGNERCRPRTCLCSGSCLIWRRWSEHGFPAAALSERSIRLVHPLTMGRSSSSVAVISAHSAAGPSRGRRRWHGGVGDRRAPSVPRWTTRCQRGSCVP